MSENTKAFNWPLMLPNPSSIHNEREDYEILSVYRFLNAWLDTNGLPLLDIEDSSGIIDASHKNSVDYFLRTKEHHYEDTGTFYSTSGVDEITHRESFMSAKVFHNGVFVRFSTQPSKGSKSARRLHKTASLEALIEESKESAVALKAAMAKLNSEAV